MYGGKVQNAPSDAQILGSRGRNLRIAAIVLACWVYICVTPEFRAVGTYLLDRLAFQKLFVLRQSPICNDYSKGKRVVHRWHSRVSMIGHRPVVDLKVLRKVYYDS